jgi:hypothetical protein
MNRSLFAPLALLIAFAAPTLAQTNVTSSGDTPRFETFALTLNKPGVAGNHFAVAPSVTFSQGATRLAVGGFFDGGDVWRVRFLPTQTGTWSYSWTLDGESGSGSFRCTAARGGGNHGHVRREGKFLRTDDGKTFHFVGSNWVYTAYVRPSQSTGGYPTNFGSQWISDTDWQAYVDRLAATNHNGSAIMGMEYLIRNDRAGIDLAWAQRIDRLVESAGARGIYLFLGIFNTWSRAANNPFSYETSGPAQILDPWNPNTNAPTTEWFISYLCARYAGYYNVLWELGNEMEHSPNSGQAFASASNTYYLPWLRQYDPYDLPVTVSEQIWRSIQVDVGGLHQADSIDFGEGRPQIHSEIVIPGMELWRTQRYRDPAYRRYYRKVAWVGLVQGGSGASEATHLWSDNAFADMAGFLADGGISAVMEDHGRVKTFIDQLRTELHTMVPQGFGGSNVGYLGFGRSGEEYIGYYFDRAPGSTVDLVPQLPVGAYEMRWLDPVTGQASAWAPATSGAASISPPLSGPDMVVHVRRSSGSAPPPPPAGPRAPEGSLVSVTNGVAAGWAADPDTPSEGVFVHFYLDGPVGQGGRYIGQTQATLATSASTVPGSHGFRYTLPSGIAAGNHQLYAYALNTSGQPPNPLLDAGPKAFVVSASTAPPAAGVPMGSLLSVTNGVATGWAADPDTPSEGVFVHFYLDGPVGQGGRYIGQTQATLASSASTVPGRHGFSYTLPSGIAAGNHQLYAYALDTSGQPPNPLLDAGPKAFAVSASPAPSAAGAPLGSLVSVANGVAVGWAADPDTPSEGVFVHFYLDGPVGQGGRYIGQTQATLPTSASTIPGAHGFVYALPAGVTVGNHRLYAYALNTSTLPPNPLLDGRGKAFTHRASAPVPPAPGAPLGVLLPVSNGVAVGWAADPDTPSQGVYVHFYLDGQPGMGGRFLGQVLAKQSSGASTIPGAHGFTYVLPAGISRGTHRLYAYALNTSSMPPNPLLNGAAVTFLVP